MSGSSWRPGPRGAVCTVLSCALALAAASVGASSSSSSTSSCDDFVCNVYELLPSTFTGCFGDVDGNGVVNSGDRGQVQANQGRRDPLALCLFDLDGNGIINAGDRGYVSANIGRCRELPSFQGYACAGNQPLSVTWNPGESLSVAYGQPFTLTATVTDPDGVSPSLHYRWNLVHADGTAVDLENHAVNDGSLTFTFEAGVHAAGPYTAELCLADRCEMVSSAVAVTLVEASDAGGTGGDGGGTGGGTGATGGGTGGGGETSATACEDLAAAFVLVPASFMDLGTVAEGTTINLAASDFIPDAPAGTTFTWLVRRCRDAAGAPVACNNAAASTTLAPNCSYLGGESDLNSTGQSYSDLPGVNDRGATATLTVDRTGPQDIVLLASHPGCGEQSAAVARVNAYFQGPLGAGIKVYRLTSSGREGCQGRWEEVNPATTTFEVGERIKFSASPSRGSIVGWSWQFMDSTGGGGEEVIKAYTAPGDYNVQLTVYRANWQSARVWLADTIGAVQVRGGMEVLGWTSAPATPFEPRTVTQGAGWTWMLSPSGKIGVFDTSSATSPSAIRVLPGISVSSQSELAVGAGVVFISRGTGGIDMFRADPDHFDLLGTVSASLAAGDSIGPIFYYGDDAGGYLYAGSYAGGRIHVLGVSFSDGGPSVDYRGVFAAVPGFAAMQGSKDVNSLFVASLSQLFVYDLATPETANLRYAPVAMATHTIGRLAESGGIIAAPMVAETLLVDASYSYSPRGSGSSQSSLLDSEGDAPGTGSIPRSYPYMVVRDGRLYLSTNVNRIHKYNVADSQASYLQETLTWPQPVMLIPFLADTLQGSALFVTMPGGWVASIAP